MKPLREKPSKAQLEELRFLQEQERRLLHDAALDDYWLFLTQVLWPEESLIHFEESIHRPIADALTAAQPGCRDLLIAMRTSRKTMLRTVGHTLWRIARDPNVRVLIVSALDATAQDFVEVIKRQLQRNKSLRHYIPTLAVPEGKFGTTYEFTHPSRTAINLVDPTVRATYLGAPFVGRRADIVILDDPIDDKHVATPEQADKALKWVNAIEPLVDRNARYNMVFVNGTRKAYNDVYAAMLGEDRGEEATEELVAPPYTSRVIAGLQREDGTPDINGKPTFPKVLNRDVLMEILARARMDPRLGEEFFWREYMSVVGSPTGRKFYDEWFDTWTLVLPSTVVWSGLVIDSATKDKQVLNRGDFTVVLLGHMDQHGHLYLTDGARSDAWRWADLARELVVMAQRSSVYNVVKEKVGEEMFFGAIETAFHQARLPCTTYPLSVRQEGKKLVRILEALQGPTQGRKIHFVGNPREGTGFPKALHRVIVDELTHLGQWSHDDAADALSLFYHKDIRIIPSAHRSVPWTSMTNARLPQGSTSMFNPSALRRRNPQEGDGSLRGEDPFVRMLLDDVGQDELRMQRGPGRESPLRTDGPDW